MRFLRKEKKGFHAMSSLINLENKTREKFNFLKSQSKQKNKLFFCRVSLFLSRVTSSV